MPLVLKESDVDKIRHRGMVDVAQKYGYRQSKKGDHIWYHPDGHQIDLHRDRHVFQYATKGKLISDAPLQSHYSLENHLASIHGKK